MRENSSLKALLERPARARGGNRRPTGSPANAVLRRQAGIAKPVSVARVLTSCGLSLRKAHELLNRITGGEEAAVVLPAVASKKAVASQLRKLGVAVDWRQAPEDVDVRSVRTALGLTQAEFAARFALDLDTVQNWEQGRNRPDRIARIVLRIIERDARSVEEAVKDEGS